MKQEEKDLSKPTTPQAQGAQAHAASAAPASQTGANGSASEQTVAPRRGHKKWLWLLALVFFLFGTILVIPVDRVPGLAGLLGRMGFSAANPSESAGRTLWTWLGGSKSSSRSAMEGLEGDNTPIRSFFDNHSSPDFQAQGPQSGLLNMTSVNAARRARGQRAEAVTGAYYGREADEEQTRAALNRMPTGWSAEAQADAAQKNVAEVYFGADPDVLTRAAMLREDGTAGSFDSVKMLAQSNTDIAGAMKTDRLQAAVMKKAAGLKEVQTQQNIDKAFESSTGLVQFNTELTGGTKAERDLAYAWLFTSAAEKAPQLMLKKQLVEAGYLAMSIPDKVYDSEGETSGIMMRGDEVVKSFVLENKQLLSDEECRMQAARTDEQLLAYYNQAGEKITKLRASLPRTCEDDLAGWETQLGELDALCGPKSPDGSYKGGINMLYQSMSSLCAIAPESYGTCTATNLNTYVQEMKAECPKLPGLRKDYSDTEGIFTQAKKNKKKADDYVETVKDTITQAETEKGKAEAALQAELNKPEEEQDPQVIEDLNKQIAYWDGQITTWTEELTEKAIPAQKKAQGAYEKADADFKLAQWKLNEQTIVVYGPTHHTYQLQNGATPDINAFNQLNPQTGDSHRWLNGLVNDTDKDTVTRSFNLALDAESKALAKKEGMDNWTKYFPVAGADASKSTLGDLLEKRQQKKS